MKPPRPTTNMVPTSRAWGCDGTPPKSGRPMKLQKTCLPAERLPVWVPCSLGGRQVVARGWATRALRAPGAACARWRRRWRLLPAGARCERRHEQPGAQEEVGRVRAEERSVGELRTRPHSIVSITTRPASPLAHGTAGEAQREEGVHLDGHRKPVDVTVEAVV